MIKTKAKPNIQIPNKTQKTKRWEWSIRPQYHQEASPWFLRFQWTMHGLNMLTTHLPTFSQPLKTFCERTLSPSEYWEIRKMIFLIGFRLSASVLVSLTFLLLSSLGLVGLLSVEERFVWQWISGQQNFARVICCGRYQLMLLSSCPLDYLAPVYT